jgi:predicted nucleic acid-binding protein
LTESERYWQEFRRILETGKIVGPQVHDARVAGLCLLHGISELWTADRDFSRFPGLKVRNPLFG